MPQALLVRLRPSGPWRFGPSDGATDRVDTLYRSDRLFSAVTLAMRQLGLLDSWLDATARAPKSAVAFSSLYPFQGDALYITPPANLWPPPVSLISSPSPVFLAKVRWRAAYFVPVSLVDGMLTGQSVLADQWIPDSESGCLLRRDRPSSSPFRTVLRGSAPVDRLSLTSVEAGTHACVEFEPGSGLWTLVRFADDAAQTKWDGSLRAAFRLLADTGFGGGRSKGWGQVQSVEFESGAWPGVILPKVARAARNLSPGDSRSYWLLSLYSPAASDQVNWSAGQYELVVRNGRVDGANGALKKSVRMVVEGCILDSDAEPVGAAVDVAPAGFAHPVYRSGIALALLLPPPKQIAEIVPPELEATPFPMPVTPPEVAPEAETIPPPAVDVEKEPESIEPAPDGVHDAQPLSQPLLEAPAPVPLLPSAAEAPPEGTEVTEPETASAPAEPEVAPEPEPEPESVSESHSPAAEPIAEPIVEVVPEDIAEKTDTPKEDGGYEI